MSQTQLISCLKPNRMGKMSHDNSPFIMSIEGCGVWFAPF